MARLCLTRWAAASFAIGLAGCTGQQVSGAWRGAFPLADAKDCRIRLFDGRDFDLSCQNKSWAGQGRWRREGDRLELRFEILEKRGELVRERPTYTFRFVGRGNTMEVVEDIPNARPQVWRRLAP